MAGGELRVDVSISQTCYTSTGSQERQTYVSKLRPP